MLLLSPNDNKVLMTEIFFYSNTEDIYKTSYWILLLLIISLIPTYFINKINKKC